MKVLGLSLTLTLVIGLGVIASLISPSWGQTPPTSAKVDTLPLELTPPQRYQIFSILEPIRRVTLVASADGVVRSQAAQAGASVREGQEVAVMDRAESSARVKIALAEVKEVQNDLDLAKATVGAGTTAMDKATVGRAMARLEGAQGRAEIAQLAFEHCALRAPFSGKILESYVSEGQFVAKGTVLAELADVTSLRAVVPVDRASASIGSSVTVLVEGQRVQGKIQAVLPLPESFGILRELTSPLAAAALVLSNTNGTLEPGQRVLSPATPNAPIVQVPAGAIKSQDIKTKEKSVDSASTVQVIRNEYVTNIKVRVLGQAGPDRVQVTGPFRQTDALIVSSSVPLIAGTLLRFHGSSTSVLEGTSPNPVDSGAAVELTPPGVGNRTTPIGAPGSALPKSRTTGTAPATTKPATKPSENSVPF